LEQRVWNLRVWYLIHFSYNTQIPDKDRHKRLRPEQLFPDLATLPVSEGAEVDPDLSYKQHLMMFGRMSG